MFRDVPGCSGLFRVVPCSRFYRRPVGYWNKVFLMEIFRSMLHGFSPFSPRVSLTELCSWYGLKDLFTNCTSQQTKLSFIIKTDDVTSGRRDVNGLNNYSSIFFVCIQSLTHDTRRIWSQTQRRLDYLVKQCACALFL